MRRSCLIKIEFVELKDERLALRLVILQPVRPPTNLRTSVRCFALSHRRPGANVQ